MVAAHQIIVNCDSCGARYELDARKIKGKGARIRCPKCDARIIVYKPSETDDAEAAPPVPAANRPSSADNLDFREVGIAAWKVKVKIGLIYDFSDVRTLRKYIQDGRVTDDDLLSQDGTQWLRIGDIPDLDAHFIDAYVAARDATEPDATDPSEDPENLEPDVTVEVPEVALEVEMPSPEAPTKDEFQNDELEHVFGLAAAEVDGQAETAPEPPKRRKRQATKQQTEQVLAQGQSGNDEAAYQFIDPFEALQKQKSGRPKQRRSGAKGTSGPSKPRQRGGRSRSGRQEESEGTNRTPLIAAAAVVLLGGWFFLGQGNQDSADAEQAMAPKPPGTEETAPEEEATSVVATPEEVRRRVRERIERELEEAERVGVENEAQKVQAMKDNALKPVVPEEFRAPEDLQRSEDLLGLRPVGPSSQTESVSTAEPQTAAQHRAVGDRLASESNWQAAAEAYKKAVALSPSDVISRLRFGESLYRVNRLDDAEPHLTAAANAGVVAAHLTLARVRANQGDDAGAMDHYRKYLASNPPDRLSIEAEVQRLTEG